MKGWISRLSLRFRLLAATFVAVGVALALSGVVLASLFKEHVTQQFVANLTQQLDQLTALLEQDAQGAPQIDTRLLTDPRWHKPYSGLYWQVNQRQPGALEHVGVLRSRSLWDNRLNVEWDALAAGEVHRHDVVGPMGAELMLLERTVQLEDAPQTLRVLVAADTTTVQEALENFNGVLAASLLVLFGLLASAAWAQVAVGLHPLHTLQQALVALDEARTPRLQGQFPTEVQPLVSRFNAVLDRNADVLQKAREQAGNLAHALKTPLTVLNQAAAGAAQHTDDEFPALVQEQVALAQRYVGWHLARARMAASAQIHCQSTPVAPVVKGLMRVLERVYADKNLALTSHFSQEDLQLPAEEQDLHEMLGNLLDNACKWAQMRVEITVTNALATDGKFAYINLHIDDDGPGIDVGNMANVLARGTRLDESVPGSGLGLAIVRELVSLYGGQMELEKSPLGGLRVVVRMPVHSAGMGLSSVLLKP